MAKRVSGERNKSSVRWYNKVRGMDGLVIGEVGGGVTGNEMNSGMSHSYGRVKITHVRTRVEFCMTFGGEKHVSVFLIATSQCRIILFYLCNHWDFNSCS